MSAPSLLFIGKRDDFYGDRALDFIRCHFPDHRVWLGRRGDPFPGDTVAWEPDYIVSYLSPWIVPAAWLARARRAALNFHPGPPEYPGIGCTNFALYHGARTFGVTCHHMAPRVDTGAIVAVSRFPVFEEDSVHSLTQRCYAHMLSLFYAILSDVLQGRCLSVSGESWQRQPYRRAELDALCRLTVDMPREEMVRRIRATTYPGAPGPCLEVHGVGFLVSPSPGVRLAA